MGYNLGAAVLLHPVPTRTPTRIPSFSTEQWFPLASEPKLFAEMTGATHFECQSLEAGRPCPAGWTNYVINWFNCYLKNVQDECAAAYSVCTSPTKPMTKCTALPGTASRID